MPNSSPAASSSFQTRTLVGFVAGDVDLEAVFGGVAGAGDEGVGQSADGAVGEPVELYLGEIGVGELLQGAPAVGALDGDLGVGVAEVFDRAVEGLGGVADPVEILLAGSGVDDQQEVVGAEAVHDDVIDEGSGGVEQGGVLGLVDGQARGVVEGHVLDGLRAPGDRAGGCLPCG